MSTFDFLPMTREEMRALGWQELDVLLITGDAYVDDPSFGVPLVGRLIQSCGLRVGIVAQPDWTDPNSLTVMGAPRLAVGVSSGNLDSMVNLYTVGRRLRREDVYSENGEPGKRPPHALVVYAQLARRAFPGKLIWIGGLEASLRRVAHYDYWQDKMRPGMLLDSKADLLMYGQGERPVRELMERLKRTGGENTEISGIPGTARLLGKKAAEAFELPPNFQRLPSWEEHLADKYKLMESTLMVESVSTPGSGRGLVQSYGDRLLVIEPPPEPLTSEELDAVHELPFTGRPHPRYKGRIPAWETIKHSIVAVRGCPGGCAFCGLVSHQGRKVTSRTEDSIVREAEKLARRSDFKGTISDIGGAAGNIFGSCNVNFDLCRKCRRSSCLIPSPCPNYRCDGKATVRMLKRVSRLDKVKHVYVNSGIRLDLALRQPELLRELIANHVSGHLKVAPEHLDEKVLRLMRKSSAEEFYEFRRIFESESAKLGKKQYLIPLFISNFPGCGAKEMKVVDDYLDANNWSPQQVQDYIPLPMTMGAAMYYTGMSPDGEILTVNRGLGERREQIEMLKKARPGSKRYGRDRGRRHDRERGGGGRGPEHKAPKDHGGTAGSGRGDRGDRREKK